MLRRVHGERLVGLMYGQRALCIGACMPLNYVGTTEHSAAKLTPFRRLVHTGKAFETIFFGSRDEADRVLAYVRRLHEGVHGELRADAGVTPAGTPYSALDPALMLWTVAVIADSAQRIYELFVQGLSPGEREELWQDYIRFGNLFGLPAADMPATHADFRRYWRDRLASDGLFLTDDARRVGYATAFQIPFATLQRPAKEVHDAVILGSLPGRIRELYGLPYGLLDRARFTAGVAGFRAARRIIPASLARGYNTRSFDGVAATERRRIERGQPTPQVRPARAAGIDLSGAPTQRAAQRTGPCVTARLAEPPRGGYPGADG